jgi:multimeric flavodoxin WrbA
MKVLAFVGSPRKGGNTDVVVGEILKAAEAKGADTETVYLNDLSYRGCQACMACKTKTETCVQKDDMAPYLDKIQEADAVVIGSPVYMAQVSGQTKTFIDRWYSFVKGDFTTRLKEGKKVVMVLTQGQPDAELFSAIPKGYSGLFKGLARVESFESLIAPGVRMPGEVADKEDIMSRARAIGEAL